MQLDLQCTLLADGHAEHADNSQSSDSKDNGGVMIESWGTFLK